MPGILILRSSEARASLRANTCETRWGSPSPAARFLPHGKPQRAQCISQASITETVAGLMMQLSRVMPITMISCSILTYLPPSVLLLLLLLLLLQRPARTFADERLYKRLTLLTMPPKSIHPTHPAHLPSMSLHTLPPSPLLPLLSSCLSPCPTSPNKHPMTVRRKEGPSLEEVRRHAVVIH